MIAIAIRQARRADPVSWKHHFRFEEVLTVSTLFRRTVTAVALGAVVIAPLSLTSQPAAAATVFSEDFDSVQTELRPRVHETHLPADLLGFTHTAPNGWSVTSLDSMAGKGVEEWRGWSFTTPEFWSKAAPGQGRENFTKASGVLAVADNDEWDDNMPATAEPHPGDSIPGSGELFTSVLSSPEIEVTGETMYVNYDSSYRQTGPQVAGLDVSFDGGERQRLFEYSTEAIGDQTYLENRRVGVPVTVPADASTMQLHWAVEDATNDWYWAIDNIDVTTSAEDGTEAPMPPAPPSPDDIPDGVSDKKFLYVSLDGVRYDRLLEANTPNLDALAERGQMTPWYLQDSLTLARTDTGPTHTNQFTGVWPDKHGVTDNSFAGRNAEEYPDFLTRAEQVRPELSTYSILDWAPLNEYLIDSPDVKIQQSTAGGQMASDERTAETSVIALRDKNPDMSFVYFHEPDGVGHSMTGDVPEYIEAIERKDELVGRLVSAIEARPTYDQEDWLIMVTTDHGMFQYGHGGNQFTVREAWGIAAGGQVEDLDGAAGREWRPVDVAASALAHVGIELDPEWDLDGIPVWEESTDPFDTVKEHLQPAVDEPAKPRDLLGWTKQTPDGWEIEENTPDKGVTEYRGWNFMTGPFWVTTEGGQGREGFVRGRDVIAVADGDEWNDIGSPSVGGEYLDSTLWSPETPVDAGGKVEVTYQHHYRQVQRASDPQTATVIAQWDTGEETVLWSIDQSEGSAQEVSQVKNLETIAPEGATSVRIGWHMLSANNFYWAIDHPIIEAEYTEPVHAPSVAESMDPATGSVDGGTVVTLTGTGFDGATGVEFGGVAGTDFTVIDDSTITVTAPAHVAGEVEVIVLDEAGNSDPLTFTYTGDDNGDDDDDDNNGGGLHDLVKKIVDAVVDLIKKLFGGLFGR